MALVGNGLVKLLEECGELSQIAAKKLAYFDTDIHPDGKEPMSVRLEDEIADVIGAIDFVIRAFDLDRARITERADKKLQTFQEWHKEGIKEPEHNSASSSKALPIKTRINGVECNGYVYNLVENNYLYVPSDCLLVLSDDRVPVWVKHDQLMSANYGKRDNNNEI